MYIKLCDRCGRQTENKPAFLVPVPEEKGSYRIDNEWFGESVCLCDDCVKDFQEFRFNHKNYSIHFVEKG